MPAMRISRRSSRSRVRRAAAVLAGLALCGVTVSPLLEAQSVRVARAHVEQSGVQLHFAHDERVCPACAAQHLAGPVPRPAPPNLARVTHLQTGTPADVARPQATGGSADPRAPPR